MDTQRQVDETRDLEERETITTLYDKILLEKDAQIKILKDESNCSQVEIGALTDEIIKYKSQLQHAASEITRLKNEKQQRIQESFMNKYGHIPQYTFEAETCDESVSFIIGYEGVGEHAEDSEASNIVFVEMCEGFAENDWIVKQVEEDYKWQLQQKKDIREEGGE